MRHIEELLGVTLFTRKRSGVLSTPAADMLYRECVEAVRGIDRAAAGLSVFAKGYQGEFSVAVQPAIAHRLVAPTLLRFNALYPNVRVRIVESVVEQMGQLIKSGEVEFAISARYDDDPAIQSRHLLSAPECIVSGAQNPALDGAGKQRLNLVIPVLKERRRAAIIDSLQSQSIEIGSVVEINSALAILDLVGRSEWATVAPCLIVDPSGQDRFQLRPLVRPEVLFKVILLQPASIELSQGADEFVELLVNEASNNVAMWRQSFSHLAL
jgi:DNA-binding transcriptional LysR family regulator